MIVRGTHGDVEVRDMFTGMDAIPRPGMFGGAWTIAGRRVDFNAASGLPAVMACIRLISETAASLPLTVFDVVDGDKVEANEFAWQAELLGYEPNEQHTAFQVWSHAFGSMLGWGNAFLLKAKARGEVQALYPLAPSRVEPRAEGNELVFYVSTNRLNEASSSRVRLTSDDVLHIPGLLTDDPNIGISPIAVHRQSLGTALAQQEYASRYFVNDGSPGGVVTVPGSLNKEKIEELREGFETRHRGNNAAHRVAILTGGSTFDTVGINMRDAQFIEGLESNTRDICRMFGVPAGMLDAAAFAARTTPEEDMSRFLLRLTPWLRRVESALEADKDIFPDVDKPGEPDVDPCVRFDTNHLVRADIAARFGSYTAARQGGWMSANEIRALEGLPPVEGGDQVQVTPVGGAPNEDLPMEIRDPESQVK